MQNLIKSGKVIQDRWTLLQDASGPEILQAAPEKNFIVPSNFWKLYASEIEAHLGNITIWLDSHEFVDEIDTDLNDLPMIALNFPIFSDGRPYTTARELREVLNYRGEIRAIGDVLRDQLFYMAQCGFDSYLIRHDQDPEACIKAFDDFQASYQGNVLTPDPLFNRR